MSVLLALRGSEPPTVRGKAGSIKALLATGMTKAQVAFDLNFGIMSVHRILTENASCQ
jgi:hypothetical protein